MKKQQKLIGAWNQSMLNIMMDFQDAATSMKITDLG